jgi:hypothetical protein
VDLDLKFSSPLPEEEEENINVRQDDHYQIGTEHSHTTLL